MSTVSPVPAFGPSTASQLSLRPPGPKLARRTMPLSTRNMYVRPAKLGVAVLVIVSPGCAAGFDHASVAKQEMRTARDQHVTAALPACGNPGHWAGQRR